MEKLRYVLEAKNVDLTRGMDPIRKFRSKTLQPKYNGFFSSQQQIMFITPSQTRQGIKYSQDIVLLGLQNDDFVEYLQDIKNMHERFVSLVMDSDLLVQCSCPDFLYNGFAYLAAVEHYGIRKSVQTPKVKQIAHIGTVCKHLGAVLANIDDYVDLMYRDFKKDKTYDDLAYSFKAK